jgi:plastocyanin
MSLFNDGLQALAAGAACWVFQATATLAGETDISIHNFMFTPDTITVPAGTTVGWQNDDTSPHTVTSMDGTFHSSALDTGDKFSVTFDKAGTFDYFCRLHPVMKGRVVVAP